MTNKERDRVLEQYTHTLEEFEDEEEIKNSEEIKAFEDAYANDAELSKLMRKAKQRKFDFLRAITRRFHPA